MSAGSLQIRQMRLAEIELAIDWAAREGWNPGVADAVCFASVDPEGFFIGECEGDAVDHHGVLLDEAGDGLQVKQRVRLLLVERVVSEHAIPAPPDAQNLQR